MKRKLFIVIGIILIGFLIIGGKIYMDSKKLEEEMLQVVYSEEGKKIFEDGLRNLDSKALTKDGIIQSYEIDQKSIKHNPMGGIDVDVIVNGDRSLTAEYNIDKRNEQLEGDGINLSSSLTEKLERKNYD